jgi:hypothetical protein
MIAVVLLPTLAMQLIFQIQADIFHPSHWKSLGLYPTDGKASGCIRQTNDGQWKSGGTAKVHLLIARVNAKFPILPTDGTCGHAVWYSSAGREGDYPFLPWQRQQVSHDIRN